MQQQFLEAEKIPGCLGWIRAHPRVCGFTQWGAERDGDEQVGAPVMHTANKPPKQDPEKRNGIRQNRPLIQKIHK